MSKLSSIQREVLVGILLGDANLQTFNNGRTYRLRCLQSEKNKEYLYHLFDIYKNISNSGPHHLQEVVSHPDVTYKKYINKVYNKYYFNTLTSSSFRFYGQSFYLNGVKVVPYYIERLLTPRSLAYWFMDDGSLKWRDHSKGFRFCTDSFTYRDVCLLSTLLQNKFHLANSIVKNRNSHRISILTKSHDDFINIISPYIIDSMKYKIT